VGGDATAGAVLRRIHERRRRVIASIVEIPTLGEWGMIVLMLGMAIAGAWHARSAGRADSRSR